MPITIRPATPADAASAGQICFDAFNTISCTHNFPPDLPNVELATGILSMMFSAPGFYCVVAEDNGRILGSNCLDERSIIHGIGPITVDPATQNRGVGRILMQAALGSPPPHSTPPASASRRLPSTAAPSRSTPPSASTSASLSPACRAAPPHAPSPATTSVPPLPPTSQPATHSPSPSTASTAPPISHNPSLGRP